MTLYFAFASTVSETTALLRSLGFLTSSGFEVFSASLLELASFFAVSTLDSLGEGTTEKELLTFRSFFLVLFLGVDHTRFFPVDSSGSCFKCSLKNVSSVSLFPILVVLLRSSDFTVHWVVVAEETLFDLTFPKLLFLTDCTGDFVISLTGASSSEFSTIWLFKKKSEHFVFSTRFCDVLVDFISSSLSFEDKLSGQLSFSVSFLDSVSWLISLPSSSAFTNSFSVFFNLSDFPSTVLLCVKFVSACNKRGEEVDKCITSDSSPIAMSRLVISFPLTKQSCFSSSIL